MGNDAYDKLINDHSSYLDSLPPMNGVVEAQNSQRTI